MITTTDLAERLHDILTHAPVWARLLRDRADRVGVSVTEASRFHEAADDVEGAARSFVWRASRSDADPFALLRVADRSLKHAHTLRELMEQARDASISSDPDTARWFAHELNALKGLTDARRGLIALPPPGETPMEELAALKTFSALLGREIIAEFEGGTDEEARIDVTLGLKRDELPEGVALEAAARVARLADRLIRCEIPDWDQPPGGSGRVRISATEDPWLDAVDHAEDWLLERYVDLDTLGEMRWADSDEPEPSP